MDIPEVTILELRAEIKQENESGRSGIWTQILANGLIYSGLNGCILGLLRSRRYNNGGWVYGDSGISASHLPSPNLSEHVSVGEHPNTQDDPRLMSYRFTVIQITDYCHTEPFPVVYTYSFLFSFSIVNNLYRVE